jgi:hypothetical protein
MRALERRPTANHVKAHARLPVRDAMCFVDLSFTAKFALLSN